MVEIHAPERVLDGNLYSRLSEPTVDEAIIQVLHGDATPEVAERVRRWRAESEENDQRYRETARVWALTEPADLRASPPGDVSTVLAAAEERRTQGGNASVRSISEARNRRRRGHPALKWGFALAAGIAALALGVGRGLFSSGPEPTASYVASADGPAFVSLDDGSFVKLAPGSDLEVWDSEVERRVRLTGRAFFAVAHEAGRPFVVRTGDTETRVLGTRFEVAETDQAVRAIVVDGLVAVSNAQGSVEVPAGSLARVREGRAPTTETPDDIYALLDWPSGIMLFQATPLGRVAREVERRFGREVEVRGEDLRSLRISGTFEQESFEQVVVALCETVGARCTLTDDGVRMER
ncbi:MAG: FecR domain-containing protein [Gemmatimonadota bacterium]